MSTSAHLTTHSSSGHLTSEHHDEYQHDTLLLDRRYRVARAIEHATNEQQFPAYHVELDIPVSITTLHPRSAATTDRRATYLKESGTSAFWKLALQAAHLRHPVLPRVRDAFLHGDTYFVVTDALTPGIEQDVHSRYVVETLAQRLARSGRLSLREALIFGLHLCDALAYVQQVAPTLLPLTTVTPRHLVLPEPNAIMISDMRPARWLDAGRCTCDEADLPYSAPEATTGGAPDVRADIYSIAAVIYHMLAGTPPPPPAANDVRRTLAEIEPLIPAALSDVIERALRADPDARFADANSFGRALAGALTELLPALVARLNTPYASPDEQSASRRGSTTAAIAATSRQRASMGSQHDRHHAETITPAREGHGKEPLIRHRLPVRQKRSTLAAISAALGLQPKAHA